MIVKQQLLEGTDGRQCYSESNTDGGDGVCGNEGVTRPFYFLFDISAS